MKRLLVFDFDGTLTTRDTLIEFIRYARGTAGLLLGLLLFSPLLVLMKLRLADNGRTKQRLFSWFFKGMSIDDFNDLCRRFAEDNRERILRPEGKCAVIEAFRAGQQVFIVSASVDNWVAPFVVPLTQRHEQRAGAAESAAQQSGIHIIGTQIEVVNGRLTGRFLTKNCYGAEKVRRLQAAIPDLKGNRPHYYIIAYGDSRGDKEMLEYADESHYKPFRETKVQSSKFKVQRGEILRFGIVGVTATLIQYGIYFGLIQLIPDAMPQVRQHFWTTAAMTVGYIVSFVFNFIASTRFTFRVKANAKRGAGFLFSHCVNYFLQMVTLNFFIWVGIPKAWAPIPMFCVCVPVNFLLVRFFLKR